jgi:hypothetical protein
MIRRPVRAAVSCFAAMMMLAAPRLAAAQPTPPPAGPPQTVTRTCAMSTDPAYALTPDKPARVGGGAMYVGARERRYLEGLRGPKGESISFKRLGQMRAPANPEGILDRWELTYDGLAAPISVYLDAYHYGEPMAPQGLTCVPFTLGPPPVDGFLASELLTRLAIEQGTAKRDVTPIPLDADGAQAHGVAFDRFRMMALNARAAAAAGTPIDPDSPPRSFGAMGMTLVAYPLTCANRTVAPAGIEIVPRQGPPVRDRSAPVSGDALAQLLPGVTLPAGAIAVPVNLAVLRSIDDVKITYAGETCDGTGREVLLPVRSTPGKPIATPAPALPEGIPMPAEAVWLQVVVDHDGAIQQPHYIGGPEALVDAALAAVRAWRAEPARINGAPVTIDTLLVVRFTAR